MTAPMVLDGPIDGEAFLAHVERILVPGLSPGVTIIMDNLPAHKVGGVREAIKAASADPLYLPPHSPDFNTIEMAYSKLKDLMRKRAGRSVEGEWNALAGALKTFTPQQCENYVAAAGHDCE